MGVSIYRPVAASEAMVRDRLGHHVLTAGVQTLASRSMKASYMTQHSWCRPNEQPRSERSWNAIYLHVHLLTMSVLVVFVRGSRSCILAVRAGFTRRAFRATAANAKAAGLSGRNVVPYVSLGAA